MKRNRCLERNILLAIEQHRHFPLAISDLKAGLPQYSTEEIEYHLKLLIEDHHVNAELPPTDGGPKYYLIQGLTSYGHDALDDERQKKTKIGY